MSALAIVNDFPDSAAAQYGLVRETHTVWREWRLNNIIPTSAHLRDRCGLRQPDSCQATFDQGESAARLDPSPPPRSAPRLKVKFATLCPAAELRPRITDELAECIREVAVTTSLPRPAAAEAVRISASKIARPEMKEADASASVSA